MATVATATNNDELPQLNIRPALNNGELTAGYKLVADSIAQQRQTLNRSLILHPLTLSGAVAIVAIVVRLNYNSPATLMLLTAGVVIALLSLVQRLSADYLEEAERIGSRDEFERRVKGEGREMVVAVWNDTVVGAVVTEGEKVWAWTVMRKYRGKGLGKDLLEAAVAMVRQRSKGKKAMVEFSEQHANSFRIKSIPALFNAPLDADERRAKVALSAIVQ
ncbi:acetyltransferase, GNAT family [Geopyxis carbonaria]|nr:acetyltransferase, GNAT family [Geopyxis carbonaria]